MAEPATPRPRPCASCPYRRDVPSGVWSAQEYERLPAYDGPTYDQKPNPFFCHQADGKVCSGWLGHREYPGDLLAVRLGVLTGNLDEECLDYTTDVPLFSSGAEAAEHGCREIEQPSEDARKTVLKVATARTRRGVEPVEWS